MAEDNIYLKYSLNSGDWLVSYTEELADGHVEIKGGSTRSPYNKNQQDALFTLN